MAQYFDNTFYRFFFSFLLILAASFGLLFATQYWSDQADPDRTYSEAGSGTADLTIENRID